MSSDASRSPTALLVRPRVQVILLIGALAVAVAACAAAGVRWVDFTPERLRAYLLSFGWWAPAVYLVAYAQPVIPLPVSIMAMAAGMAFGLPGGFAAALVAATLRACGQFLLARRFGRWWVERLLRGHVATLDTHMRRSGFQTVMLIRIIPNVPFDLQNFSLGCSAVRFRTFAAATALALVPSLLVWVSLGHGLVIAPHVRALVVLLAALVLAGPLAWSWRRARRRHADS